MTGHRGLEAGHTLPNNGDTLLYNVWFQKISIPPPRRELEIPKGGGGGEGGERGQRPRKFQRGGGLSFRFSFQRSFDSIRISKSFLTY